MFSLGPNIQNAINPNHDVCPREAPGPSRAAAAAGRGSPVIARRISVAAASLISSEACSLYQAVWGVQMRFGASFKGP